MVRHDTDPSPFDDGGSGSARVVSRQRASERGAVAVLVALMMVFLLGFVALAVDVSSLYQERRTLQNGADAGALAVVKDCPTTGCVASKALALANSNADDGKSNVDEVCGTGPGLSACATPPSVPAGTRYVKVTTSTNDASGGANSGQVNFLFAPVLDLVDPGHAAEHRGQKVRASAVAAYGSPAGATTLPLTFSVCEYQAAVPTPASLQTGPPFSGSPSFVSFHTDGSALANTCPAGPSGFDLPGGFGWLQTSGSCTIDVTVGNWVNDKTGNSEPSCLDLTLFQNRAVLLPIYDELNGSSGSNGGYHLFGFAAFYITGYRFPGDRWPSSGPTRTDCPGGGGGTTCIRGYFTGFTTTGDSFGGPDMGTSIFKLVG